MVMNRRNVLVGIALVAVVSGLALGSGAFTQVEATRNVNLEAANDASALLSLNATDSSVIVNNADTGANGFGNLNISNENLNDDAITTVEEGIVVQNNGDQTVGFYAQSGSGVGNELDFIVNASTPGNASDRVGNTIVGSGSSATIGPDETVRLDVKIDTTTGDISNVGDVTFVADTDQA